MHRNVFAGVATALATSSVFAAVHSTQLPVGDYGHQDQNGAGITNGDQACGPTSVVNSFTFLQNLYPTIPGINNLIDTSVVNTINKLEAAGYMDTRPTTDMNPGTTIQNLISGKSKWIQDRGLANEIGIEGQTFFVTGDARIADNTKPTLSFLFDQLDKHQDVEILFAWWDPTLNNGNGGYAGGHYVTVTGLTYDDTDGTGSLSMVDPWGGGDLTASLGTHNGFVQLSYSGGAATDPRDPDNPDRVGLGDITSIVAESPIPAPGTIVMLVLAGGVSARRRRV